MLEKGMILWNAELTKRLSCEEKEKAALPSLVHDLLALSDKARGEGIKALLETTAGEGPMLSYGCRLIAEGYSEEVLEEILAVYLTTSTLTGFEFLKQCISAEALLGIAAGDSRDLLLRKLAPYCGADKATALLRALDAAGGENGL